jgi:hypothetical protein
VHKPTLATVPLTIVYGAVSTVYPVNNWDLVIPDAKRTTVDVSVIPEILNGPASVEVYPDGSVNVINMCLFLLFYKYFYSLFYAT